MEVKIVKRPSLQLIGLSCHVTLTEVKEEKRAQKLFIEFMTRKSEIQSCINHTQVFGVSTDPENYNQDTDTFEFFVGVEVSVLDDVAAGMVTKTIPENDYVVFTFKGPVDQVGSVHDYLYSEWLPNNNYQLCGLYNLEVYDERHHRLESEESIIDIYFPISKSNEL